MKRKNLEALAKCPECKAICLLGNDEDGQVHCAKCRTTFLPNEKTRVTAEELEAISHDSTKEHVKGGWFAYEIK